MVQPVPARFHRALCADNRLELTSYRRPLGLFLLAITALGFGLLAATQLKAELLVPSNRVARSAALVRTAQQLERVNRDESVRVSSLREDVNGLESAAARRSDSVRRLQEQVAEARAHAGRAGLRGPGVTVDLASGRPAPDPQNPTSYLVGFTDIEDVVNLLFESGAEAVAVNGRRVTPATFFAGAPGTVLIDQGLPISSPLRVVAVGNRAQMEQALGDSSALGDLRNRQRRFGIGFAYAGAPDLSVPASDAALRVSYAKPA